MGGQSWYAANMNDGTPDFVDVVHFYGNLVWLNFGLGSYMEHLKKLAFADCPMEILLLPTSANIRFCLH